MCYSPWGLKDTKECPSAAQPPAECLQMASGCLGQRLISEYVVIVAQLLGPVRLFATPWIAECQASLSATISQNLLKLWE